MKKERSPLVTSATQFLVESLNNFRGERLDFSILHAVTAIELFLKERLSRIHPNLIYTKIDLQQINHTETVSLAKLPHRLVNLGINIDHSEIALIKSVAEWRNQIVHYMPTYSRSKAVAELGRLYDFMASFLKKELKLDLRDLVPKEIYPMFKGLLSEWEELIKEAKLQAIKEGQVEEAEECPVCYVVGVVSKRKNELAYCYLCQTQLVYASCFSCGQPTLDVYPYIPERGAQHSKCYDRMMAEIDKQMGQ